MNLSVEAIISFSQDQIIGLLIDAIKVKYGIDVSSTQFVCNYLRDYEDVQFQGYRVELTEDQIMNLKRS